MYGFIGQLVDLTSNVYGGAVMVPDDLVESYFSQHESRRVLVTFNNEVTKHQALTSTGDGLHFLNVNKEIRKKFNLDIGSSISVSFKNDDSKYGMALPEEMKELLAQDELGNQYFHKLTPGKQRSLLHMVDKLKSSDKRISKAITIIEHLKDCEGNLDFKLLNRAFKEATNPFG